jgi:sulfur carrier protein
MKLIINGENREFDKEMVIKELLKNCNVKSPDMVSVELNGQVIPRDRYVNVIVSDGDKVEFLYFMGGGKS